MALSEVPTLSTYSRCGLFWHPKDLSAVTMGLLHTLTQFYTAENLETILLPLLSSKDDSALSLRALDWLVINYAKKHRLAHFVKAAGSTGGDIIFDIFYEYKLKLRSNQRVNFDPFRRGKRLFFELKGKWYATTVGQLNFVHWAHRFGVLDYAQKHAEAIVADHAFTMQNKRNAAKLDAVQGKKRKRTELSKPLPTKCAIHKVTMQIVFERAPEEPSPV